MAGLIAAAAFAVAVPWGAQMLTAYVPGAGALRREPSAAVGVPRAGVVGSAAAQDGDLTASMVKRYCGIKDYGAIFPGHGGMLDRMDSVLFAGVILYVFFTIPVRW